MKAPAVSYTHLDVYKRQAILCTQERHEPAQILGILCVVHLGHALLFFIIPAQSHTVCNVCLLYTSWVPICSSAMFDPQVMLDMAEHGMFVVQTYGSTEQ